MEKEICLWEEDESYKSSKNIVRSMRVANSIAERALIDEYNKLIITNKEQKQFLFWW